MVQAATQRAKELRHAINLHNHKYYVLDEPTISDSEYDVLLHELGSLESEYPQLLSPDSPTQRVGGPPADGFAQINHSSPMHSLGNAFNREDLKNWMARTKS